MHAARVHLRMSTTALHPPRLLIASHHAEAGLALKELGEKNGYTVLRCFTATQALERARADRPDVIVLDESLLDVDTLDTSRALRDDPLIGASTPILLVTASRPTTAQHRAALRGGVWEFLSYPFNEEEVAARLVARAVRAAGPAAAAEPADGAPPLRVGYDAVGNTRYTPVEPKNLLSRATSALRIAKTEAAANWIRGYEQA